MYRSMSVMFQILFEYEFICKLPRKDFLPWQNEIKDAPHLKLARLNKIDQNSVYFMRAVPRRDLYTYCLPENLIILWYFVKQNFVSRKNRVIPALE